MTRKTVERLVVRLAWFRAEESGAARMDRVVLVFGLVALTALLAMSMMRGEAPGALVQRDGAGTGSGSAPVAPDRRMISAAGRTAPEPTVAEGAAIPPPMPTAGYVAHFDPPPRPDTEAAFLAAESQRVRAEEDAARAAAEAAAAGQASEAGDPATSDGS